MRWRGRALQVHIAGQDVSVTAADGRPIDVRIAGRMRTLG
jgi:hypothetical protein